MRGGRNALAVTAALAVGWAIVVVPTASGSATASDARTSNPRVARVSPAGCLGIGAGFATVFDSTTVVKPVDSACGFQGADVISAQNEFESFQVSVRAPAGSSLANFQVSLSQCFEWCRASQAAADTAVTIYREDYVGITRRSDMESLPDPPASPQNPNGGAVRWPDPLIPAKDYFYGETRNAFQGVTVPAGENRTAWVDVLVPPSQASGTYNATLQVSAGGSNRSVPVTLTVVGIQLPSTPTLQSPVDLTQSQLCPAFDNCAGGLSAIQIDAMLSRLALENRFGWFNANSGYLDSPGGLSSFRQYQKPYLTGTATTRLAGARMPYLIFSGACIHDAGCLPGLASAAANENWGGSPPEFSFYCEELFESVNLWNTCYADWLTAKQAWTNAGATGLRVIAVAPIEALEWATTHTNWHTATTDVTTLMPIIQHVNNGSFQTEQEFRPFPGDRSAYDRFLDTGPTGYNQSGTHRLYTYTSCVSLGCATDGVHDADPESDQIGSGDSIWRGWPSMVIDQPGTEGRAMGFVLYLEGITGEQYYQAVKRFSTAWNTCAGFWDDSTCQFSEGGNGDGTLLYPGTVARIGGTHPIPIESIRVKRFRDGREDYEWMKWLDDHGQGAFARTEALKLFPQVFCTESPAPATVLPGETRRCTQTATTEQVRAELAAKILGIGQPGGADLVVSGQAPAAALVGDDFAAAFHARNDGPQSAPSVVLTDTLGLGVKVESVTPNVGTCSTAAEPDGRFKITCTVGALASGSSLDVTATLVAVSNGTKGFDLAGASGATDPAPGNNSASQSTAVSGTSCTPTLIGTNGPDTLNGTAAAEVLCGLGGNDVLNGGAGNDQVIGGAGNDTMDGGPNDDVLMGGPGDDSVTGGDGLDTASYADAQADGQAANLLNHEAFCLNGNPAACATGYDSPIATVERLSGSPFNDTFVGDALANVLTGGAGNDVLDAQDGNDSIAGGPGNDSIQGGPGTDTVDYSADAGGVSVDLTVGTQAPGGSGTDTLGDLENVTGTPFADTITGTAGPNVIIGGAGGDTVRAGDGADIVYAGPGSDTLDGGPGTDAVSYFLIAAGVSVNLTATTSQNTLTAGYDTLAGFEDLYGTNANDTLYGTSGPNHLYALAGNDVLNPMGGADVVDGGSGTDLVSFRLSPVGVSVNLGIIATYPGDENVYGSDSSDTIIGNSLANRMYGFGGNDKLYGNDGNDYMDGGTGNDYLYGNNHDDTLYGQSGIDALYGHAGKDYLDGGTESDYCNTGGSSTAEGSKRNCERA